MKPILVSIAATAALGLAALPAKAAGPYDGSWVVDAPQAGGGANSPESIGSGCEPIRIQFQVQDNRVTGELRRSPQESTRVESGPGRGATPITGTVQPDGTLNAAWESYHATGKLTGNQAEVRWTGACGPRVAMGGRAGASESSGSSTGASGTR